MKHIIIDPETHKPIEIGKGIMSAINNTPKVYLHDITLEQIKNILESHKQKDNENKTIKQFSNTNG